MKDVEKLTGIAVESLLLPPYQLEKPDLVSLLSLGISPLDFFPRDFSMNASMPTMLNSKTIKMEKGIVSVLDHHPLQMADKPLRIRGKSVCLYETAQERSKEVM